MKFCANISFMFCEASSIVERYALAKSAGFKAVESAFPSGFTADQVREAKEKAGLEQVLINLKTDDVTKGVTAIPGKEDEFKADLRTTIQYAKALHAKKVHVMAGIVHNPTQSNWDTYESNLKYAAKELEREGLIGVIEPINQHSVPGYFLSDYGKAAAIIGRVGSAHLRLLLDIFHLQRIAGDLSHHITTLLPVTGHVQIAQVPDRHEPHSAGEVNYQYVLTRLEQAGYSDWVGLEYTPRDGLAWLDMYGYSL